MPSFEFDSHANLVITTVGTAPASGTDTTLTVADLQGTIFPVPPFNCVVWPPFAYPTQTNSEIIRVDDVTGDTLTIERCAEGSATRSIQVGDNIAIAITAKTITDIEDAINAIGTDSGGGGGTGTDAVAEAALAIAIIGTNLGTDAVNLANAAQATADEALRIAIIGTNVGTTAENLAYAAQATANEALGIAIAGTQVGRTIMLCGAFTPVLTGPDNMEVPVPFAHDGTTSVAWNVVRAGIRVQTSGSIAALTIEKSVGTGVFSATTVGTVTLPNFYYEASTVGSLGTINSGDKTRFNVLNLGLPSTPRNWTVTVELAHP